MEHLHENMRAFVGREYLREYRRAKRQARMRRLGTRFGQFMDEAEVVVILMMIAGGLILFVYYVYQITNTYGVR